MPTTGDYNSGAVDDVLAAPCYRRFYYPGVTEFIDDNSGSDGSAAALIIDKKSDSPVCTIYRNRHQLSTLPTRTNCCILSFDASHLSRSVDASH